MAVKLLQQSVRPAPPPLTRPSARQKVIFHWWLTPDGKKYDGIICDGSVRSGKTVCMALSFTLWSMTQFTGENFAVCGKTIGSARRNVLEPLRKMLKGTNMTLHEKISANWFEICMGDRKNRYYLFGGRDESSAALIQGMTLAGVLFDECVLMPRSFVEQSAARCSVTGAKMWFNCNPSGTCHWFKTEWLDRACEKRLCTVHLTMDDNPSLSAAVKERYKRMYTGVFYDRFILGKWTQAEGAVYPMFDPAFHVVDTLPEKFTEYMISCDYGTVNPSSFGLWGKSGNCWYRISEYYYDSKASGLQRTDEEHYAALEKLAEEKNISAVIIDPSAASFIECVKRHRKYFVIRAENDVVTGIRKTADLLASGKLFFSKNCRDIIREFSEYSWENTFTDSPRKENDHAMDDMRYFVCEITKPEQPFFVASVERL